MKKYLKSFILAFLILAIAQSLLFSCSDTSHETSDDTEDASDSSFIKGLGGSDNTLDDLKFVPQIMLTFRIKSDEVQTVLLIKGEGSKTFRVPDTFCLSSNPEKVDYWKPIDPISFAQGRLPAGKEVTLDYDSAKELFGVKFKGTVIKMAGYKNG